MSVINRMLDDLERRGSPGARRQHNADRSARVESRRGGLRQLGRLGPPVLLIALLIVAAALWREQWPGVLALVDRTREPASAERIDAGDDTPGEASLPDVRLFRFEHEGATTHLVVTFERPLDEAPGYGRRGDRLGLQLPARWDPDELPAPPENQSVYRSAVVDERGDEGIRIGMRVDPDARFDLAINGATLTLTGRAPSADDRDDSGDRAASDDPDGDTGPAMEAVADVGDAGGDETANNGSADAMTNNAAPPDEQGAPTGEAGQADRSAETGNETGDTDAPAGAGEDVANPGADADESVTAAARTVESDGQVRKSEPDIAPRERARRLEGKARDALDDGDVTAARRHLTNALEFDPDRHSARDLLVGLSLRSGDSAAARNLLAEGVARAPERGTYAKPFARLLVDAGDLERALRVLRRAAPAENGDAGYHGLTAAIAQRLKRHELAASEYTRALEIDSSRGVWWMGLGISLRATDHPDEALAAFREARESGDLNERLDHWVQQRIDALSRTRE